MPVGIRRAGPIVLAIVLAAGCGGALGRQYEYEEQIYLDVSGSATIVLDASVPALVALRGLPLETGSTARLDRADVRRIYESAGCDVVRVGRPWRRDGRRFVQVRLRTDDVRTLGGCPWLAASAYRFEPAGDTIRYRQTIGASAGGNPGAVNWRGDEIVAFKLHLPSRILEHNVKRLEDGSNGTVERGNILTWEQRLADRIAGQPVAMDVTMASESILYRTVALFAGAFLAAVALLAAVVWLVIRRGRKLARGT